APSDLVDVSRLKDLQGVKVSGKTVTIGAATTHYDVSTDEKLKKVCPALAHMASLIGDPAVRHKGTLGGSIANNDPAADYPAALLALGATIIT
ncbi:MAG: carbon monoxide dehydrogenase, partial [Mesorhizobium sp.]